MAVFISVTVSAEKYCGAWTVRHESGVMNSIVITLETFWVSVVLFIKS
jgi:hypothetical protein